MYTSINQFTITCGTKNELVESIHCDCTQLRGSREPIWSHLLDSTGSFAKYVTHEFTILVPPLVTVESNKWPVPNLLHECMWV